MADGPGGSHAEEGRSVADWGLNLSAWPESEDRAMAEEIARYGLVANVAELEMFGFTVVHADRIDARELALRVREKLFDVVERRTGERPDLVTGETHRGVFGRSAGKFLHEDRAFQELMMHPIALALVTYLLGKRCLFSESAAFIKGPAEGGTTKAGANRVHYVSPSNRLDLGLHADQSQRPGPFGPVTDICNTTWLLSDYSEVEGSIAFVPGSHRLARQPLDMEFEELAVPINAPMGSMVIFAGGTWHGSLPRKIPGLRIGMPFWFCRAYMRPMESMHDIVTPELLEGMPPRFATLMGADKSEWGYDGLVHKEAAWPFRPGLYT